MTPPPSTRGRRSARMSGDDRERAILAAAEAMLAQRTLDEISIDDLAGAAGISRPTFYFYFASKDAVLLQLLDRVIAEVDRRGAAVIPDTSAASPDFANAINVFVEVFAEHRGVTVATVAARLSSPAIQELWSISMQRWVDHVAEVIAAEQERGAAPRGIDPHHLSTVLNTMNEQVLSATFTRTVPFVPTDEVGAILHATWRRAIYGR
ncbi:MAG: TetR/AcrR family transcriptional regulator [Nakamurella sp.]